MGTNQTQPTFPGLAECALTKGIPQATASSEPTPGHCGLLYLALWLGSFDLLQTELPKGKASTELISAPPLEPRLKVSPEEDTQDLDGWWVDDIWMDRWMNDEWIMDRGWRDDGWVMDDRRNMIKGWDEEKKSRLNIKSLYMEDSQFC